MKIGEAIKKIRKDNGTRQKDFAVMIGISQTYLSQIEKQHKTPNFSVIETISIVFNIPVPVMMFIAMDESDVRDDKKELYNRLKPTIDNLIKEIFL